MFPCLVQLLLLPTDALVMTYESLSPRQTKIRQYVQHLHEHISYEQKLHGRLPLLFRLVSSTLNHASSRFISGKLVFQLANTQLLRKLCTFQHSTRQLAQFDWSLSHSYLGEGDSIHGCRLSCLRAFTSMTPPTPSKCAATRLYSQVTALLLPNHR